MTCDAALHLQNATLKIQVLQLQGQLLGYLMADAQAELAALQKAAEAAPEQQEPPVDYMEAGGVPTAQAA